MPCVRFNILKLKQRSLLNIPDGQSNRLKYGGKMFSRQLLRQILPDCTIRKRLVQLELLIRCTDWYWLIKNKRYSVIQLSGATAGQLRSGIDAFQAIGEEKCLSDLLNSPGNFTASKLAWVKQNEPEVFEKIHKVMLPGDFIAMKLSGEINISVSSLSEGVFWDFTRNELSKEVLNHFGFPEDIFPEIQPVFSDHGRLSAEIAGRLSLKPGIPLSYKAGDQPNNALSLNVLKPGEVAANGGTSGVIYGVSDQLTFDKESRINSFAHVNFSEEQKRIGVLLCINGTGILNRWTRDVIASGLAYDTMNIEASVDQRR
jgi:xylulokinase